MRRALSEYRIAGVQTTIPFCRFVLEHPVFLDGTFSTHFVSNHFTPDVLKPKKPRHDLAAAVGAALAGMHNGTTSDEPSTSDDTQWSPWVAGRRRFGRRD
jgi:propionyl-CoA carboxylase alpha chain